MIKNKLLIKSFKLNFIYSCIPVMNSVGIASYKSIFGKDTEDVLVELNDGSKLKFDRGIPKSRRGISQYMTLKLNAGFTFLPELPKCNLNLNHYKFKTDKKGKENYRKFKTDNTDPQGISFTIHPIIRIFPYGSSVTFEVRGNSIENKFYNENDIQRFLHLIGMNKNCSPNYLIESDAKPEYLTSKFYKEDSKKISFTLYGLFQSIVRYIFEDSLAKYCNKEIQLLCKTRLYKGDPNLSTFENIESQSPWVVSCLEVGGQTSEIFNYNKNIESELPGYEKSIILKPYQNVINGLCLRIPDLNLEDFRYEDAYSNWAEWSSVNLSMYNLYYDERLFVQMSRRSIFTLTEDDEVYPSRYFIPALLELSEMTRSRWQTLVILNDQFDEFINELYEDSHHKSGRELKVIIDKLLFVSKTLETPSLFVVSEDSLKEIHERLNETFNIELLVKTVLKKSQIYEKLYKSKLQLDWLKDTHE